MPTITFHFSEAVTTSDDPELYTRALMATIGVLIVEVMKHLQDLDPKSVRRQVHDYLKMVVGVMPPLESFAMGQRFVDITVTHKPTELVNRPADAFLMVLHGINQLAEHVQPSDGVAANRLHELVENLSKVPLEVCFPVEIPPGAH